MPRWTETPEQILWYYDTGQTAAAGTNYVAGRPLIDSSGNVYVPVVGRKTGTTSDHFLLKFNSAGVLQWTYDPGDTGNLGITEANYATNMVGGTCFDNSGNIIWGHDLSDTTNYYYATSVSPSGSLVTRYGATTANGFGGGAGTFYFNNSGAGGTCALSSIACDASNNLYWIAPVNFHQIAKVSSTGAFVSANTLVDATGTGGTDGTTSTGTSLIADVANSKLFFGRASVIATGSTKYATTTRLITRLDMATMANDWHFTIGEYATTLGITLDLVNSNFNLLFLNAPPGNCGRTIGYNPNTGELCGGGGYMLASSPSEVVENICQCTDGSSSGVLVGSGNTLSTSTVSTAKFVGMHACCDPTSGFIYGCPDRTTNSLTPTPTTIGAVNQFTGGGSGGANWSALNVVDLEPMGICAATY